MRATSFWPLIVGAQIGLVAATAFAAPANLSRVGGAVTKVDSAAKTITVTDRRTQSDVTFAVTGQTKYTVSVMGTLSDLKVGDKVRVMGEVDGTTVDARFIAVVPEFRPANPNNAGRAPRGVEGTVVTLAPSVTVKTTDAQTDTVSTTADTRVITSKPGALDDITVGKFVMAEVDASAATPVAKQVQIMPAGGRGFGGGRGGGGRRGGAGAGGGQ